MNSARAPRKNAPAGAVRASVGALLCLFAALFWAVRSFCPLPVGPVAEVPSIVAGFPDAPSGFGGPSIGEATDAESEETEVETAESSADEDGDSDDSVEEACSSMVAVGLGSPPGIQLQARERSPSTKACVRRHPRPAEAV